jgi:hypothetical protein
MKNAAVIVKNNASLTINATGSGVYGAIEFEVNTTNDPKESSLTIKDNAAVVLNTSAAALRSYVAGTGAMTDRVCLAGGSLTMTAGSSVINNDANSTLSFEITPASGYARSIKAGDAAASAKTIKIADLSAQKYAKISFVVGQDTADTLSITVIGSIALLAALAAVVVVLRKRVHG